MNTAHLFAPKIHDFKEQLAWSEAQSYEVFWDAVYRKAFPNLLNHMPCPGDTESQRMGIDRVIMLKNGLTLRVDEKKRREVYNDILLEYVSVDTTGASIIDVSKELPDLSFS